MWPYVNTVNLKPILKFTKASIRREMPFTIVCVTAPKKSVAITRLRYFEVVFHTFLLREKSFKKLLFIPRTYSLEVRSRFHCAQISSIPFKKKLIVIY